MRSLILLLLAVPAFAASEWVEVTSPNFQLFTTSGEGDGRRTIEYFEQVRDFFMNAQSKQLTTKLPVYIILFKNQKEFRPYAPNDGVAAFFTGDESRDFIVMYGGDDREKPIAVHEYMHLLIRHLDLKLPVWLNEGIAEVYSTLKPLGGKIAIGTVPAGAGHVLSGDKWLPLDRLFAIDQRSPEYNEKNRRGILYAQSWMMTHMLMLSDVYRPKFANFLGAVSTGNSAADAFLKVYGKTVEQVSRDLNAYFRANSLKGMLFDARLQKIAVSEPKAAQEFDVELALARLSSITGKQADATARLERLTRQQADRWEPWEALAHVAWRQDDRASAAKYLRRAVDLKPPAWNVYWDYARLADPNDSTAIITALKRSLELNGNNTDARLMLGYYLYQVERFKESVAVYKTVRSIDGERASRLFLGIAHAAVRAEDWKEAESAAAQATKYARTPADISAASQISKYLEDRKTAAAGPAAPVLAARAVREMASAAPGTTAPVPEDTWKIRGLLRQVDCLVNRARLRIAVGSRTVSLLIADPDKIVLTNQPGSSMNLTCGAQPEGTDVTVDYVKKPEAETQTEGEVRSLQFGKAEK